MRRHAGFALMGALWLVVSIGIVSLGGALALRVHRGVATNLSDATQARLAAESGVERVRARIRRSPAITWVDSARIRDAAYRTVIRDLGTTVDLNRVDEEALRRLFTALNIDAGDADRLAQAVADWRDRDDLRRGRGAEIRDYVAAGAEVLPANAPFSSVAELRSVRGVSARLYERLAPFLSTDGSGQVNLAAASEPVLRTLPGMSDESVETILRLQASGAGLPAMSAIAAQLTNSARRRITPFLPELERLTTSKTREIEVVSEGSRLGADLRVRVRAILALSDADAIVTGRRIER